jgi:hypothetical protein
MSIEKMVKCFTLDRGDVMEDDMSSIEIDPDYLAPKMLGRVLSSMIPTNCRTYFHVATPSSIPKSSGFVTHEYRSRNPYIEIRVP